MAVEAAIREGNVEMATKNQEHVLGLTFDAENNPIPSRMTVNSIDDLADTGRIDSQDSIASLTPRHNRFLREAAINKALAYDAEGNPRRMPLQDEEFIPSDEINVQRARLAADATGYFRVGEDEEGAHYTALVGGDTLFGEAASADDIRAYFPKARLTEVIYGQDGGIPDIHQTITNTDYQKAA